MLPDLEKIIDAERRARKIVAQAQNEAEALLAQARSQTQSIQADLQIELTQVQNTVQEQILQQAEARVAEEAAATDRYLQEIRKKQENHGEEAITFLVSQVLS